MSLARKYEGDQQGYLAALYVEYVNDCRFYEITDDMIEAYKIETASIAPADIEPF